MKFGLKVVLVGFFSFFTQNQKTKTKTKKTPNKTKQKTEYLSGINSYLTTYMYLHAKTIIILSLDIWKMEYM